MSRAKWLFLGLAVVVAGCATGSSVDDAPEDDSGSGTEVEDAKADGQKASDANGAHDVGHDTTTTPPGDDDSSVGGEDTGNGNEDTGSDTNADEDAGADVTVVDANIPDTNVPDTTVADAGHDAHDANVPDTNVPDTNVPDTNIPDTNIPDTNIPDTNIPDTNVPDTSVADAGCSPTGSGFTTAVHTPATQAKACTSTQATNFYTACLTGTAAACAAWENSNGACASCLEGATDPTGATWGPYTQWPLGALDSVIELDIGGCLLKTGESTSCGHDFEYLTECEHFYCGTSCFGNSFTHYQDCAAAADKNQCLSEYNAVYVTATPCTTSLFNSSTCLTWTTFQTGFQQIAAVMCE